MKKTLIAIFFILLILFTLVACNTSTESENKQDNLFKKNHIVTLIADNLPNNKITVDDGDTLVINFNPQKDNYIFQGWYTYSACTVPYEF